MVYEVYYGLDMTPFHICKITPAPLPGKYSKKVKIQLSYPAALIILS